VGTVCAMPPVTPDRISLPDRYRVVRHLANGGMASVWEAHDELLDRDVAVKLLASHLGEDDRARKRFQREARAAAGLSSHPNVVTIYDVGEHKNRVFMVMEIMRGGTLGDRLKGDREIGHPTAIRWLHEAAAALDTAHEAGVVHRDIKPGNLLLDGRDRLAVADFGIARLAWEDQLTATGQVLGTAAYISPEQAMGEAATSASDRYAFAVVAYELLTGTRPFEAEHFAAQARAHVEDPPPPASERAPELSRAVDAVLERGLAKDPADRWKSSEEFVDALERTLAQPAPATKPTRRVSKRAAAAAAKPVRRDEAWADDGDGRGARDSRGRELAAGRGGGEAGGRGDDGSGRRGAAARADGGGRDTRRRTAAAAPEPKRSAAPLLIGLGLIALLAVIGAVALASRGGDDPAPRAESTPTAEATATASPEKTAEPTPTASPEPTDTPTAEPTDTPTPEPTPETPTPEPPADTPKGSPSELQAKGHQQLLGGDVQAALTTLKAAVDSCGASSQVDPCAYAMYDYASALVAAGRPAEAVPVLQARLQRFDNQNGTVRALLKKALKAANE
jgi:tRNA A-37 threonylcarbamoyl transferase component Bud32